jgi:RNA polymerase sigma factor, sigma-70 family
MMEHKNFITEKILESMKSIFAFSRSRVANATEAEDLSQQIITELLASAETLKDENAFYSWMWAVARNTYSNYIRAGKKENHLYIEDEDYISDSNVNVENDLILKEDINILHREMSLFANQYREAVVKYYIEEKSCYQISEELAISVETVKNLLFKARKILKEGINMVREYGEKSYKPDMFRFNMWVSEVAWENIISYSEFTKIEDFRVTYCFPLTTHR